ncbi:MAG: hypothetical protein EP323_01275 [Gammaproteobacteria bacterium]|nr:MAG: hypothetical protein EP323_01275 [Gammaproteobacteria bacterium]
MLRNLLDNAYNFKMEEIISEVVTILESQIGGLAHDRLEEIAEEAGEIAAKLTEPPAEEQLMMRFPGICEGCEE